VVGYTHAYFPVGLFDEVCMDHMEQGYIFGRKGDTYVMLSAKSDAEGVLMFKNDLPGVTAEEMTTDRSKIKNNVREMIEATGELRYDLIFQGGNTHAWITEVSSVAQDGSFEEFIARIMGESWTFEEMTVRYTSAGKELEVSYDAWFKVNGENVDMDYARYESPYVDGAVERKAEVITLRFNGKTLELNYKAGTRVY
jgi:hypothetical protein